MKVAIIPARGGSKRIPKKNIRRFAGQPMLSYSILAARETGLFDKIIVSTDSDEIAAVAREWGAEVPFIRPAEIADDYAGTTEVVAHAIRWLQAEGQPIEAVCCLYATAPLVRAEDIVAGYRKLMAEKPAYVFSATTFAFPVFRAFELRDRGEVSMLWPEHQTTRSQDLVEAYHDAGQFYWAPPESFLAALPVFASHSGIIHVPRHRVQDIDTLEDWKMAEALFAAQLVPAGDG